MAGLLSQPGPPTIALTISINYMRNTGWSRVRVRDKSVSATQVPKSLTVQSELKKKMVAGILPQTGPPVIALTILINHMRNTGWSRAGVLDQSVLATPPYHPSLLPLFTTTIHPYLPPPFTTTIYQHHNHHYSHYHNHICIHTHAYPHT